MKTIIYTLILLFCFCFEQTKSQAINDFGTISSGTYTDPTIWRQWDGVGWNNIPATYPNGSTQNAFIRAGHTVTLPAPGPYNLGNLNVETGGKLFTNNPVTNVYISIWGLNIVCNGEIGNGTAFDGIAFNIDGPNCTINGTGTFTASRIRKNSTINATTFLVVNTNVTLRWDVASNTQFYNNIASAAANFNLTINAGCTLNCEGSPGSPGNFSMDGINGTSAASAGGQISVFGTLNIPGIMYATTNNTSTANQINLVVYNGGILRVGQINSPASSTGLSRITVQSGGKLELTGLGFPIGTANWNTTNNRYDFAVGSTVEYSALAAQNILNQGDFRTVSNTPSPYWHLIISGSGIKPITTGLILTIRGNLTITGNAILDQDANDVDIQVGGNWTNYSFIGFLESTNNLKNVKFYGNFFPVQEIFCPGGEHFNNLSISKTSSASGAKVRLLSPITINNQLVLGDTIASIRFGILELNQNSITLNRSDSSAIKLIGPSGNYRYIISEDSITRNNSIVNWKIDSALGNYIIPFGISNTKDTIPVYLKKISNNNIGTITVSTYGTPSNNLPYPSTPINVTNLFGINNPDNKDYTVDRFWYFGSTKQINCDTIILTYNNSSNSELPVADPNVQNLKAQLWDNTISGWQFPSQYGFASLSPYPQNSVTIPNFNFQNTVWTLTSINSPLPVELIIFDAESENKKIKIFWTTLTETNNDYFILYKSNDAINFQEFAVVPGNGNSNSIQNYFVYDYDRESNFIYYKLKQIDFDGQSSESSIIVFKNFLRNKKIIKIINYLGQEINLDNLGFKIIYYDDGTIEKRYFE